MNEYLLDKSRQEPKSSGPNVEIAEPNVVGAGLNIGSPTSEILLFGIHTNTFYVESKWRSF